MKLYSVITAFTVCIGIVFSGCGSNAERDKAVHTITLETVELSHTSTFSKMSVILAVSASNRLKEAQKHLKDGSVEHTVQNILAYSKMCREGIPRTLKLSTSETDFTVTCNVLIDALTSHKIELDQFTKSPFPALASAAQEGITSADNLLTLIENLMEKSNEKK